MLEFNDGNKWHYVIDPGAYLRHRNVYCYRTASAINGRMYIDERFKTQRRLLRNKVDLYIHYQFPWEEVGTPEEQAHFFCNALGELWSNEAVMLDIERASRIKDPANFARRWLTYTEGRLSTKAWVYVPSELASVLTRSITGTRIVVAPSFSGHDGKGIKPTWPHDVWQFSDRGFFPGTHSGIGGVNCTTLTLTELKGRSRYKKEL